MDQNYNESDIAEETLQAMADDCRQFQADHAADLLASGLSDEKAGHCFWLNRNGHGSGFWDEYSQTTCEKYEAEQAIAIGSRDFSRRNALNKTCPCPYHICQRLSDACKPWGSVDLYIGDDGKIHSN